MADTMQFAGDYQLDKIAVWAATTKGRLDIKNLMVEMNIYESIFSPSLSGSLTVSDTTNHLQNVPFIGQEELEFQFGVPDNELIDFSKHRARITKVSNMVRIEEREQVYTLNFTTREMVRNLRTVLESSYAGSADQIIEEVLDDDLGTQKNWDLEPSSQRQQVVGNSMNPFEFCSMVAKRGSSRDYESDGLLFFENHRGYHCKSYTSLSQLEPVVEYFAVPGDERDVDKDMMKILEYRVTKNQDVLAHTVTGLLASTHYTYDINTKSYTTQTKKYFDTFDNTLHTEETAFPIYSTTPEDQSGRAMDSYTKSSITSSTKNSHLFTSSSSDTTDYSNTSGLRLSQNHSVLSHDALTVKCTVPGNSVLAAGDIVELNLPSLEPQNADSPQERVYDQYSSGRYLLTNIVHTITPTSYTTTFDATKDCVRANYVSNITPNNENEKYTKGDI